jgi:lipopolysaccharide biosynthesis regulator YciM
MPFEPPDRQCWEAAVGYVELGMFLDADAELERIDPFNRAATEVLAIRIAIYQGLKEWGAMREIAKRLAEFQPEDVQYGLPVFHSDTALLRGISICSLQLGQFTAIPAPLCSTTSD